ncbi:MAG: hypothetical protein MUC43_07145 [Pirellula sp.]|nr:hypothetical protein [Pirellula sp.]
MFQHVDDSVMVDSIMVDSKLDRTKTDKTRDATGRLTLGMAWIDKQCMGGESILREDRTLSSREVYS